MHFNIRQKTLTASLCASILPLLALTAVSLVVLEGVTRNTERLVLDRALDSTLKEYEQHRKAPLYDKEGNPLIEASITHLDDLALLLLKKTTGLEVTLYEGRQVVASSLEALKGTTLNDQQIDLKVLKRGERHLTRGNFGGQPYLVAYSPLKDGTGESIGMLSIASLEGPRAAILSRARLTVLYALAGGLTAAILTIVLTTGWFQRPWERLVNALKAASEGDLTQRLVLPDKAEAALSFNKMADRLEELTVGLKEMTVRDSLTGLYNCQFFQSSLKAEYDRSRRYGHSLSCIMLDLDHFQEINKRHGHAFGDYVLAEVAKLLLGMVRSSDIVARYGGEEFFIVLPVVDVEGAVHVAQRIQRVFGHHIFLKNSSSTKLTLSMGISGVSDKNVTSARDLILHADQALRTAKNQGGNALYPWRDVSIER